MTEKLLDHYEEEKNYEEVIRIIDEIILKDPQKASSLLFRKANALIGLEKILTGNNHIRSICKRLFR